jgi:hypothetical protein
LKLMRHCLQAERHQPSIQVGQYKHLVLGLTTMSAKIGALVYQAPIPLLKSKEQMIVPIMIIFGI